MNSELANHVHSTRKFYPVTHENYPSYKQQIIKIMCDLNWLSIADGSEKRPQGPRFEDRAVQREWDSRDKVLRKYLASTLSPELQEKFKDCDCGYDYWQMILSEFEGHRSNDSATVPPPTQQEESNNFSCSSKEEEELFRLIERQDSSHSQPKGPFTTLLPDVRAASGGPSSSSSSESNSKLKSSKWSKLQELTTISQREHETLNEYVSRLVTLIVELQQMGVNISSECQIMHLLNGLKGDYGQTIAAILNETNPEDVTLAKTVQLIIDLNPEEDVRGDIKRDVASSHQAPTSNLAALIRVPSEGPIQDSYIKVLDDLGIVSESKKNSRDVDSKAMCKSNASTATEDRLLSEYVMVAADASDSKPMRSSIETAPTVLPSTGSKGSPNKNHRTLHHNSFDAKTNTALIQPVTTTAPLPCSDSNVRKAAYEETQFHRGLLNRIGENNCFLNVTIQALWHLGPFRAHLRGVIEQHQSKPSTEVNGPQAIDQVGLLDTLCNLFVQYEFTDESVLPPTELRMALSALSSRFELGSIADANEAFDTILQRIHRESQRHCDAGEKCLSHMVFGGMVMEQASCVLCGATSEPAIRRDFILCVQAAEILSEVMQLPIQRTPLSAPVQQPQVTKPSRFQNLLNFGKHNSTDISMNSAPQPQLRENTSISSTTFGRILRKCMTLSQRSCPSLDYPDVEKRMLLSAMGVCPGKANVNMFSLEAPLAIALSIGWTAAREDKNVLAQFYSAVSLSIRLDDIFHVQPTGTDARSSRVMRSASGTWQYGPSYLLRGMVCYYGLHYVSIFQAETSKESNIVKYMLFDDQNIRDIGDWKAVQELCVRSLYQPVLLLYELEQ